MDDLLWLDLRDSALVDERFYARHLLERPTLEVPDDLDPRAVEAARFGWEDRANSEYIGVMVMRHFHGLLVDLGAPLDVQELGLVLTLQEQRHAALCVAAARALGGSGEVPFDVRTLQKARTREPLEHQLLAMIVATFAVGEVVAMRLVTHAMRALPESGFRDILRAITADEVLHARIGLRLLRMLRDEADWFDYPGDDHVRELARTHIAQMRSRDVVEPEEEALFADPTLAADLVRLGIPPTADFRQEYHAALDDEVPALFGELGVAL